MDKDALQLIENCKKEYSKQSQRAELLKRNKQFLNEAADNIPIDYFVDEITNSDKKIEEISIDGIVLYLDIEKYAKFKKFCNKWNIFSTWDGNFDTLSHYLKDSPEIITNPYYYSLINGNIYQPDTEFSDSAKLWDLNYIYLKLDAWTSLESIKKLWPRIEVFQKAIFAYKFELKTNFGRDLCWYDLNKQFDLSPNKIALLWAENRPDETDLIVIKNIKRNTGLMQGIREEIDKNNTLKDLQGRSLDDKEFMNEIRSGRLFKFFKNLFKDEKRFYISGETGRGKFGSPFVELIKQAIKRMKICIENVSVSV